MEKVFTLNQADNAMEASKRFTATVAATAATAIEEVDNSKQDKIDPVSVMLSTTGWKTDSDEYPCYYDIADSSITAADRADVMLLVSESTAVKCRFNSKTTTHTGFIRIRSKTAPKEVISAEYSIIGGKR